MEIVFTNKETKEKHNLAIHTKDGTKFFRNTTKEVALELLKHEKNLIKAIWGERILLHGSL